MEIYEYINVENSLLFHFTFFLTLTHIQEDRGVGKPLEIPVSGILHLGYMNRRQQNRKFSICRNNIILTLHQTPQNPRQAAACCSLHLLQMTEWQLQQLLWQQAWWQPLVPGHRWWDPRPSPGRSRRPGFSLREWPSQTYLFCYHPVVSFVLLDFVCNCEQTSKSHGEQNEDWN